MFTPNCCAPPPCPQFVSTTLGQGSEGAVIWLVAAELHLSALALLGNLFLQAELLCAQTESNQGGNGISYSWLDLEVLDFESSFFEDNYDNLKIIGENYLEPEEEVQGSQEQLTD